MLEVITHSTSPPPTYKYTQTPQVQKSKIHINPPSQSLHRKMQVNNQQTTVVQPIKPPFTHDHILSLSHIDTDPNLHVTLRYLRVYHNTATHHHADPFHVITAALSAALEHYHPLAGTLRRRSSDGRLELHCHVGDGVPVISAAVNSPLVNIDLNGTFAGQLVPDPDPNEDMTRPMLLQVTKFSCGGYVLGAAVHHAICDGIGATIFFNAVAELARGSGQMTVEPVWDRTGLLGPRDPPRVEFPMHEVLSLESGFVPYTDSGKRVVKEYFSVKDEWLNEMKGWLYKQSGLKCTTFEALGAFIWRARTKAYKIPGDEKVTFAYSINIRKLLTPPLPAGYWGNGCVPMYVHLMAEEVAGQPLWKTTDSIKKSKHNATNEYVRSFLDFQELHYKQGITAGRRVSGFTDWRHLGHSTVDFRWGGPVAVVPLSTRLLGSMEPCFFLPEKEGVKVLVHLEEDVVMPFRQEMDELRSLENVFKSAI